MRADGAADRGDRPTIRRRRSGNRPSRWPPGFVDGQADRTALLVLMALRGISPIKLLDVADRERTAAATLEAVRGGRAGSDADREFARGLDPDDIDRALVAYGASLVPFGSADYPPQLENLEDPPAALFVRGRPLPPRERAVAIVGLATAPSSAGNWPPPSAMTSPHRACASSAGRPVASTPPGTRARSMPAVTRSRCWGAGSTRPIRGGARA